MRKLYLSLIALVLSLAAVANTPVFNIRDFGAVGDGVNIDSPAFNKAIIAASQAGGGVVLVPEGTYLCFSIRLKSNILIRFEEGSVVKAAPVGELGAYDAPEPNPWDKYQDFGHSHWQNSLFWGIGIENFGVEGPGLIDGTGVLSRGVSKVGVEGPANKAFGLKNCKNVSFKDVTFLNSGHFSLLLTGVDNLLIDNVTADTNRDAFDIDCCENVEIRNCRVNTLNDDAIVLKCSYGLGWAKPCQNVLIEDCEVSGYDIGSYLSGEKTTNVTHAPDRDGPTGRVKLGTESNGGFRNIEIRNIRFNHCRGLALESVDGACLENIKVSGLVMDDINNSPIYIRLGDRMRGPEDLPSSIVRNIEISDVKVTNCDSRYALLIVGLEGHPVENVLLKDISIQYRGGLTKEDVKLQRGGNDFFGRLGAYPEPASHGIQPAWGLSVSYARNMVLDNAKMELMNPDQRPKIYKHKVKKLVWK